MRVSSLLKVSNESQALALDIAATARLKIYDDDKEKRMIEAMVAGTATQAMNGIAAGFSGTKNAPKPNANLPRQ